MTAFINTNDNSINSMIYLETQERQLHKKQDFALSGRKLYKNSEDTNPCDWISVFDGHGDDVFINMMRSINKFQDIIAEDEPMDALVTHLKKIPLYKVSGSTGLIVKIFKDEIRCWSVGDSQVAIFVNGQQVYISCPHNMKNPLEQERLAERIKIGIVSIDKHSNLLPQSITKTTMIPKSGEYINHSYRVRLAMSQALGDDWVTGIAPEKFVYKFM